MTPKTIIIRLESGKVQAECAKSITAQELAKAINTLTNLYLQQDFKITRIKHSVTGGVKAIRHESE